MLTQEDKELLQKKGISEEKLQEQLQAFKNGFPYLRLAAAAAPKQGIAIPTAREQKTYLTAWNKYLADGGHALKFVPAS